MLDHLLELDLGEAPVALEWSRCGRWLAALNVDGEAVLIDTASANRINCWTAHGAGALALAWHPKQAILATSCQNGCLKLWQVDGDQGVRALSAIELDPCMGSLWVERLRWRPDGKQLAFAIGNTVMLASVAGEIEATFIFKGGTVADLDWRPGGALLGIAGYGGIAIQNGLDPLADPMLLNWKGSLLSLSWSPDGAYIVAGCQDNTVHLWRFRSQQDAQMSGFAYKPLQLSWVDRGKRLLTSGINDLVMWPFDRKGPEGREPETRSFHEKSITTLAVAANGKTIATGCRSGWIAVWKSSREITPTVSTMIESRVEYLRWSSKKNGKRLAAVGRQGILRLFDLDEAW